jgi:hypothetical protein
MRLEGNVALVRRHLKEGDQLEDLYVDGRIVLKVT